MRGYNLYFANMMGVSDIYRVPVEKTTIVIPYIVYDDTGHKLVYNTDYLGRNPCTVEISSSADYGDHKISIDGKDPYYYGTYSKTFKVELENSTYFSGEGTSESPYLINNVDDWNKFIEYVNHGYYNATIKNLHTAGTIFSSAKHASGLVGHALGNTTIENCLSTVTLTANITGDATFAGFVGEQGTGNYNTTIKRSVFDGKILGASASHCAGFVGWRNMYLKLFDCLFIPSETGTGDTESATFARNGITEIANSYYTSTLGKEQGMLSYAMTNKPEIYVNVAHRHRPFQQPYLYLQ